MKKRKIPLLLLVSILLLTISLNGTYASNSIKVTIDGSSVKWTDAEPFIDDNYRTMVPLRAVGEALGLNVDWNNSAKEAIFTKGSKTIYFPIDSMYYRTENGAIESMDTAAVIVNNRTYAPVRYLAEYFGYTVNWDGSTWTVVITSSTEKSLVWVLTDSSYEVTDYNNDEYNRFSFNYYGIVDGMVRFERSGGYYNGDKQMSCDGIYECEVAPETIPSEGNVSLKMNIIIDNYVWKNNAGINSVHIGTLSLRAFDYHDFKNDNGENNLHIGTAAGDPYTDGNIIKADDFSFTFPEILSDKSTMKIVFRCEAGTYTWNYESQYI